MTDPRNPDALLVADQITRRFGGRSESQELGLPVAASGLVLPCGAACRWER